LPNKYLLRETRANIVSVEVEYNKLTYGKFKMYLQSSTIRHMPIIGKYLQSVRSNRPVIILQTLSEEFDVTV